MSVGDILELRRNMDLKLSHHLPTVCFAWGIKLILYHKTNKLSVLL